MFSLSDLFQWERFVTPSIIKVFYWMIVAIAVLLGLSGIGSAFAMFSISPGSGFLMLLGSLFGIVVGVVFARIAAEFVLIVFRINEHLSALRGRNEM